MHRFYISPSEFRLVGVCWFILLAVMAVFWTAILRRFAEILKSRGEKVGDGLGGVLGYLFRGEYAHSGDRRLAGVCQKLRNLLFAYIGCAIGFVVYLALLWPRY